MGLLVVAVYLRLALTAALLTGDGVTQRSRHDEGVQKWIKPGNEVPSDLLRLVREAAAAKKVRGGPVAAHSPASLLHKSGMVIKAGDVIVEQLEDWKDHGLAAVSKAKPQHEIATKDYESLLNAFVACSETRFVFSKDIEKAERFITEHMKESGLHVRSHEFVLKFSDYRSNASNIVGELRGSEKPEEFVVLGAHYDSIPESGPAPGAEDNGSGVAAMLLAARAMAKSGFKPKRSIRFIAFTGEEVGLRGSAEYVHEMSSTDHQNFRGAIILDEVAFTRKHDHHRSVIFETHGRDQAQEVVVDTMAHATRGIPGWGSKVEFQVNYAGWGSDHMSFLDNGLPAVLLIEKDNLWAADHFGHTARDNLTNIDYEFGASTATIAATAIANLADPANL